MSAAEPRNAKPESLEAKFKLLSLLPYDKRAKRKHCLVFGFILDWYHGKYGDALASVRHVAAIIKERDAAGVGLYAGDVHAALTDLVAWGYLEQELGTGRRASRYVPVWAKLDSVNKTPNATDSEISVRENANICVRENLNTTGDSVRDSMNEDPLTRTRLQDRVTGRERYDCAAPTAPPPAGPVGAAEAGTSQGGFDELWGTYDYKRGKTEARRAYSKLGPDADLHAKLVKAARKWRKSWTAQGKPDAPRFTLTKWIEREEYDCEPPAAFTPKQRKPKPTANNDGRPAKPFVCETFRPQRDVLTITGSRVTREGHGRASVFFDTVNEAGEADAICFDLESTSKKVQDREQARFHSLLQAVDLAEADDSSQLHGRRFVRVLRSRFAEYEFQSPRADDSHIDEAA